MRRRKKPDANTVEDFSDWLNTWAKLDAYRDRTKPWRDGYRQAVRDVYDRFFDEFQSGETKGDET